MICVRHSVVSYCCSLFWNEVSQPDSILHARTMHHLKHGNLNCTFVVFLVREFIQSCLLCSPPRLAKIAMMNDLLAQNMDSTWIGWLCVVSLLNECCFSHLNWSETVVPMCHQLLGTRFYTDQMLGILTAFTYPSQSILSVLFNECFVQLYSIISV